MCKTISITISTQCDILSSKFVIFLSSALLFLLMCYPVPIYAQVYDQNCSQKLQNCTKLIYPYLHNVNYMFPASIEENDEICNITSVFVDCIRRYLKLCFSKEKRNNFNKAVKISIDAVHAICSSRFVKTEYVANIQCFKKVLITNCGDYYQQLIDHVSTFSFNEDHACCLYRQFKDCVTHPISKNCGMRSRNLLDHSMAVLIIKCSYKFIANRNETCLKTSLLTKAYKLETNTIDMNDLAHKTRADRSLNGVGSIIYSSANDATKDNFCFQTHSGWTTSLMIKLTILFIVNVKYNYT